MLFYIIYVVKIYLVKIIDVRWILDNWCKLIFFKKGYYMFRFFKVKCSLSESFFCI